MGRSPRITNQALLAAAREIFQRDGIGASTKDIAAHAGISEATIYKRYPTKEELIVAAMAPPPPDVAGILAPLDDDEDPRGALSTVMGAILDYFREALPVILPLIAQPEMGLERFLHHIGEPAALPITAALAERLAKAARAGDIGPVEPFAAAGLLVATAHSLALFEIMGLHGGATPRRATEAMLDALWFGLLPRNEDVP